jgi:hypothetical protein
MTSNCRCFKEEEDALLRAVVGGGGVALPVWRFFLLSVENGAPEPRFKKNEIKFPKSVFFVG